MRNQSVDNYADAFELFPIATKLKKYVIKLLILILL